MKLLKEPLVHFLLAGLVVLTAYGWFRPDGHDNDANRIVVDAEQIRQLQEGFENIWRRPPGEIELSNLIDDHILEEAYYRRALDMGLEEHDVVIRRRLRQKLEFLTEPALFDQEATEEALRGYLETHPEKFLMDDRFTFEQVFIDPDRHKEDLERYVEQSLETLRGGGEVVSDSTLMGDAFDSTSSRVLSRMFGETLVKGLIGLPVGEWSGPVQSGFGLHLVRLQAHEPGRLPELDVVREQVKREWQNERRIEHRKAFDEELRSQFEIVVEPPSVSTNNQPQPPGGA